jgi:hypothetical protein
MPLSLLAQYISGKKKPSITQKQRNLNAVQQVGRELTEISFCFEKQNTNVVSGELNL